MKSKNKITTWLLGAAFALVAFSGISQAATFQNIAVKCSISGTKSVLIVGATTYNFGAQAVATSSVSATAITVRNNSSVFIETYTVTGANAIGGTVNWTIAASTAGNRP